MSSGAEEFKVISERLNSVPKSVLPKARAAMRKAAFDIQAGAMNRAPVRTGFLKGNIVVTTEGNGDFGRAVIEATANYSGFVEEGTSRMAAQPFMRPATDAVLPGYDEALEQIIGEALDGV